jgi:hypothetical protein
MINPKHRPTRQAVVLVILYSLVASSLLLATACPQKSSLRQAVEASYRLPGLTNDLIKDVREGRDRGIISPEQASKFGDLLNKMATAELAYIDAVKVIQAAADHGQNPAPGQLSNLQLIFDTGIVGPFLDVLTLAKVVSSSQSKAILLAVEAVRLLLRTIGGGIGSTAINTALMAAKVI